MITFSYKFCYFFLGLGQFFRFGCQVLLKFITFRNGLCKLFLSLGEFALGLLKGAGKIRDDSICLFQLLFKSGYLIFQNIG